jgi:sterol desaturase/sphingolipid hydroxylase (fatty acid hydroxylase superfamily)
MIPAPSPAWGAFDPVTLAIPAFVALVLAEMIYVRLSRRGDYETWDTFASLSMGLGNSISGLLLGGLVVVGYAAASQARLFDLGWTWPVLVACFFAEDFCYYWYHRTAHERRLLWASHVVHHSSQHYNLSTALRQPWTGPLSLSFLFKLPLVLIGFPAEMVLMFAGLSLVYQFWIHTEAVGRLGPLEWVLNTPSHHRVHHAVNPRYLDANYGGVLIIWDRLFATFVRETEADRPNYGIIANLGTFNPVRIAFHEWWAMAADLRQARTWRERLGFVLGPPGWSPDGSRKTSHSLKAAWRAKMSPAFAGDSDSG